MKKVYTSKDEIAHLWAHQLQDDARTPSDNFYFNGKTIYSYGSHFPIAKIVEENHPTLGTVCLFTTKGYSVTTSQQMSAVRQAIPGYWTVINVETIDFHRIKKYAKDDHKKNIKEHLQSAFEFSEKQKRARKYDYTSDIEFELSQAKIYVEYYKLKSLLTKAEKELLFSDGDFNASQYAEIVEKKKASNKRKRAKADRERLKKAAKDIEAWKEGANVFVPYQAETMLRLTADGKEIETSRSSRVPLDRAKLLWKLIKNTMDTKTQWKKNGKTFEIGNFSVDRVEIDGTTTIGCHVLIFTEIKRMADIMKWN